MEEKIKVIKTLPHLHKLFIPKNEISVYSTSYSPDILKFLRNVEIFNKDKITFTSLKNLLNLEKVDQVSDKLQFSIKGDIITFWPLGYEHPLRAEFFGEDLEKIYTIDELYNTKLYDQEFILLSKSIPEEKIDRDALNISIPPIIHNHNLISKFIVVTNIRGMTETSEIEIIDTDFTMPQLFYSRLDLLTKEVASLKNREYTVIIKSKNQEQIGTKSDQKVIHKKEKGLFENLFQNLNETDLPAGFLSESLKLAVLTDREIFGSIYLTRPEKVKNYSSNIKKLLRQFEGSIEIGNYVVHEDYGIGIYAGLTQERVDDQDIEYLLIQYAKEDELYVPINQIEKITKYIGNEGYEPRITRLGKLQWEHVKAKIKKSTSLLARELVEHYAHRQVAEGEPIKNKESKEYLEFTDDFLYKETEDQIRAVNEITYDLQQKKPMDRLLIGDVGFGKTEVIMRAAFKVIESGGQVAVLSPTTVLTAQHFEVFTKRFKNFPVTIGFISRFKSTKENSETIDLANQGKIDILIGTHRILGNDVKFKNLQLIVVDEEQRFGVKQKEKIKKLNYGAHLLSVSATPIPRTLSMALSSIQSLSIITTPPVNRKPIKTEIVKQDWDKLSHAITNEVQRGGQVYFLNNEVQTIASIKARLEHLNPGIKFIAAHGQMSSQELDRIMTEFYMRKYDCLIATTIIENGLDIPSVNTIIINQAHRFGLSQLYQLRGRVGRAGEQAYCYLVTPTKLEEFIEENEDGVKKKNIKSKDRMQALVDNQDLGAGFRIASRDLEIRGAGNLLGDQQSGHISTVGYALYIELLAQEIEKLKQNN